MISLRLSDSPSVRKQSSKSIVFATIGTRYLSDVRLISGVLSTRVDFIPTCSLGAPQNLVVTTARTIYRARRVPFIENRTDNDPSALAIEGRKDRSGRYCDPREFSG